MAGCNPWYYLGINSRVFQSLQTLGRKQGFAIPNSPSGGFTVRTAGLSVHFKYAWNKNNASLQLECVSKPQLISCAMIKSMADRIVSDAGGRPA